MDHTHTPAIGPRTKRTASPRTETRTTRPDWARPEDAARLFSLSRSLVYELISDGTVRSASLRRKGAVRGVRLVSVPALEAYISAAADATARRISANSSKGAAA